MRKYWVTVPVTARICVEVEAEDRESAIDKAFDEGTLDDIEEWEMHEQIVDGNVFYGLINEIDVIEQD